jgi:hypothetical protein
VATVSKATLEADMRDHPKWLSLSPLAYKLGVRLVLWAVQHSRGSGFVPEFVVREYAGTKTMATKLAKELGECGKKFGRAGILDTAEGGYVVHDLLTDDEPADAPRRPLTKAEAGRIGGQASVEARKAASGSASPKHPASASVGASGSASASTGQAAPDPTCQEDSGYSSKTSSSSNSEGVGARAKAPAEASRPASRQPKRWRKIPADWMPQDELRLLAATRGVDFDEEIAKLRDHEFQPPREDPDATARNWIRNARQTLPPRASAAPQLSLGKAADDAAARAKAAEVEARMKARAAAERGAQ